METLFAEYLAVVIYRVTEVVYMLVSPHDAIPTLSDLLVARGRAVIDLVLVSRVQGERPRGIAQWQGGGVRSRMELWSKQWKDAGHAFVR
jgi:hypothetical protein